MSFSVLMGIYKNDSPLFLKQAIESILHQTKPPEEVYIVKDGPLTIELESLVDFYQTSYPEIFTIHSLKHNTGLGNALKLGLLNCRNDLIARMDSDDISRENRFELQLNAFDRNKDIDLVGGFINEFAIEVDDLNRIRKVPLTHNDVLRVSKYRSPVNHVSVMYKRQSVIRAGNYQPKFCGEDYDLWLRMLISNCKFINLKEVLVDVRVGNGMIERRKGIKMFNCEKKYLFNAYHEGFFTFYEYHRNILIRFIFRSLPSVFIRLFYSLVRSSK